MARNGQYGRGNGATGSALRKTLQRIHHTLTEHLGPGGPGPGRTSLFKQVNDKHGHSAGDSLLKQFAEELRSNNRPSDVVGRWGR